MIPIIPYNHYYRAGGPPHIHLRTGAETTEDAGSSCKYKGGFRELGLPLKGDMGLCRAV